MSPQQDSFSDHVEIVKWLSKRSGYTTSEDMACMSAAIEPFDFDNEDDEDFDWE